MSCTHYRWAWTQPLKGNRLLVLLNLCERADESGQCYPSIARISQDTGMDRKTIIGALNELEAAGLIEKNRQPGTSNQYRLLSQNTAQPVPKTGPVPKPGPVPKTVRGSTKNGTDTSTKNGTQNPPLNPALTPQSVSVPKNGPTDPPITTPPPSAKPRKRPIPPDFGISPAVEAWASQKGYGDLKAHLEAFTEKAKARGYQYVDWDAALRTAIREDWAGLRSQKPYRNHTGGTRHGTHQPPLSAVERCRQSSAEWLAAKQHAAIIDLDDYRPERSSHGGAMGPPGGDLWPPLDLTAWG